MAVLMKSGKRYLFLLVAFFFLAASGWPGQKAGIRQPETAEAVCEVEERENCGETGDRSETSDDKREAEVQELPPQVAITFDDGPHKIYTPLLLDGLKEREVKATFFLIGENISGKEEIIRRMAEEGHLIGNHTYSHVKLTALPEEAACEEIRKTSERIFAITGKPVEYLRPPFGEWKKSLECGLNLFPVLWTVDTLDWTTENVSDVVRRGTETVKDGDVILLHDCYASSVKAALAIIDTLKSRGFQFVTVEELIL